MVSEQHTCSVFLVYSSGNTCSPKDISPPLNTFISIKEGKERKQATGMFSSSSRTSGKKKFSLQQLSITEALKSTAAYLTNTKDSCVPLKIVHVK